MPPLHVVVLLSVVSGHVILLSWTYYPVILVVSGRVILSQDESKSTAIVDSPCALFCLTCLIRSRTLSWALRHRQKPVMQAGGCL